MTQYYGYQPHYFHMQRKWGFKSIAHFYWWQMALSKYLNHVEYIEYPELNAPVQRRREYATNFLQQKYPECDYSQLVDKIHKTAGIP